MTLAPPAPIGLRPAGPFDLDLLAALHGACFAEPWDARAVASLLAMPGAFGLVAETDGPAGFLLARAVAGEAEILSLGVRPDRRRRGIGRALLAGAVAEAAAAGAARLYLEVAADNAAGRALYLAHGFAQIGCRTRYYRRLAGAVDALVLARALGTRGPSGEDAGKTSGVEISAAPPHSSGQQ